MSYFASGFHAAALALAKKDWTHPSCLILARHMAHEGKSAQEIAGALGWDISYQCTLRRLAKYNIRPLWAKQNRAHRGQVTSLPYSNHGVSTKPYRARAMQ